jgi:hypothetical protein
MAIARVHHYRVRPDGVRLVKIRVMGIFEQNKIIRNAFDALLLSSAPPAQPRRSAFAQMPPLLHDGGYRVDKALRAAGFRSSKRDVIGTLEPNFKPNGTVNRYIIIFSVLRAHEKRCTYAESNNATVRKVSNRVKSDETNVSLGAITHE